MIGPVVDWPAIIASVEDNIRKEETTLLELTEKNVIRFGLHSLMPD